MFLLGAALLLAGGQASKLLQAAPRYERVNGNIETVWQRPSVEPKGLFFIAHGCQHQGTDIFSQVELGEDICKNSNSGSCLGLPEEVHLRNVALSRGYVVMAVSGGSGRKSCWNLQGDAAKIAAAVKHVKDAEGLPEDAEVVAMGASSGGAMVGRLAVAESQGGLPHLKCILPEIMGTPFPNRGVPVLYIHMPRDTNTAFEVEEEIEDLKSRGIRPAELRATSLPVTAEFMSRCLAKEHSETAVKALSDAGILDERSLLREAGKIDDSLRSDESCLAELMNVAWAKHEFTGQFATEMIDFCEDVTASVAVSALGVSTERPWQMALTALLDLCLLQDRIMRDCRGIAAGSTGSRERVAAISGLARKQLWQESLVMFEEMLQRGPAPDKFLCGAAISACERGRQWLQAVRLLRLMWGDLRLEPNTIVYNAAVSACDKGRQWSWAVYLADEMDREAIAPDVVTCSALISACAKGRQWERALALLPDMAQRRISPNAMTYSAAISACESSNEWPLALVLLLDMCGQELRPDVFVCSAAISACSRGGRWEEALSVAEALLAAGEEPSVVTCNALMTALDRGGQWQLALDLLAAMKGGKGRSAVGFWASVAACRPDIITFSAAVSACGNAGAWQKALELLAASPARNLVTINSCITACAVGQQWRHGLQLLLDARKLSFCPDIISYNAAISACEKCGQWQQALALLAEAQAAAGPDIVSFN
ncbi:unnamed protein product, partial [Polarella glacialis]